MESTAANPQGLHSSHRTRNSDSPLFGTICDACNVHDGTAEGLRTLQAPCRVVASKGTSTNPTSLECDTCGYQPFMSPVGANYMSGNSCPSRGREGSCQGTLRSVLYETAKEWDGKGGYITTYTGEQVMLADPSVDSLDIEDIAHALAMICHFGGHTMQFFSVAQHSVLVARAARALGFDRAFQQWGLLHDAPEAYLGDVTRPLKVLLPGYRELERPMMNIIAKKFALTPLFDDGYAALKRIDDSILKLEAQMLMRKAVLHDGRGTPYDLPDPPELPAQFLGPMNWQVAKATFLREFEILFLDDDGF